MKAYPLEDIKAPAYLYIGNSVLFINRRFWTLRFRTTSRRATFSPTNP